MPVDLYKLANDANISYRNQPGYLGCTVRSTSPPVLALEFDSDISAHAFEGQVTLISDPTQWTIKNAEPNVVLKLCT